MERFEALVNKIYSLTIVIKLSILGVSGTLRCEYGIQEISRSFCQHVSYFHGAAVACLLIYLLMNLFAIHF